MCVTVQLRCRNSSVYLGTLAAVDSGFLVALFGVWLSFVGEGEAFHRAGWCQAVVYVIHVCSFMSVWTVVAFTCENWIVIYHPLRRHALCTRRRAAVVMGALTATAVTAYSTGVWMPSTSSSSSSSGSRQQQQQLSVTMFPWTSVSMATTSLLLITTSDGVGEGPEIYAFGRAVDGMVSDDSDMPVCTMGGQYSVEMQRYFAAADTFASVIVPSVIIVVLNYAIWIKVTRYLRKRKAIHGDCSSDQQAGGIKSSNRRTSSSEESANRRNNNTTCNHRLMQPQSRQPLLQYQNQQNRRSSAEIVELMPVMWGKRRASQLQLLQHQQLQVCSQVQLSQCCRPSSSLPLVRSTCNRRDCVVGGCSASCGDDACKPRSAPSNCVMGRGGGGPRGQQTKQCSQQHALVSSVGAIVAAAGTAEHHLTTAATAGSDPSSPLSSRHHHHFQYNQQYHANGDGCHQQQPYQRQKQQGKVQSNGQGQNKPPSQSVRVRATRALAVMSAVFLLLHLPSHGFRLHALAMVLTRQSYELSVDSLLLQELFQFMYYVKFSSNLFVYFACWKDFRWALCRFARGLCSPYRRLRQSRRR
jgi:hypothetical protein